MIFKLEYLVDGQRMEQPFNRNQITIGRDASVDFVLNSNTVSRQHAVITVDQNGARLTVLSRGGLTAVNGRQVSGEVPLVDGCQIHFGQLAFTFRSEHSPAPQQWNPQAAPQLEPAVVAPPVEKTKPKPELTDENTGGIRSWDDIAAGADEEDEDLDQVDDIASNFQKLQKAAAKADKSSKGTNPVVVIIGLLAAVAMLAFTFYQPDQRAAVVKKAKGDTPVIEWQEKDIICTVPADCRSKAIKDYLYAVETFEKREVDIINLYESYKSMDHAKKLLERGEITEDVPEMKGMAELKAKALKIMERKFVTARQAFHRHSQRNENRKMAAVLNEIQRYFPDKRCKYYRWATVQERSMRDKGIYIQGSE